MPRPLCLITGIAGFAGSFLAEELLTHGYAVAGTKLPDEPTDNLEAIADKLELIDLDIRDAAACGRVLTMLKPKLIFHLAAFASVGKSFEFERLTYDVNITGTLNVLQAAMNLNGLKKLVFVSSSDVYGQIGETSRALGENQPLAPISPYAISKATGERLCAYYQRQYGVPVVVARAFNHTGPRQSDAFVVPSFAHQIAQIEAGRRKPILKVGNLSARRDLSDVRDIVEGYRLIAEKGTTGEVFQLCSGKAVAIESILNLLLKLSTKSIRVTVDKRRLRKADIPVLKGSCRKAAEELGFVPQRPLRQTLQDTLDYFRQKAAQSQKGVM